MLKKQPLALACSIRRIALTILTGLAFGPAAFAVQPQFWKLTTPEDFLAGEIDGMAVTSSGELIPGPGLTKLASFTEPFVLSQAVDPAGPRYFGTGNDGKVYQLKGSDRRLLFTASEPEIYALTFVNGALFVGSSPHGKVYKANPADGTATEFFNPGQAYIWAMAPLSDGGLAVATGLEGKLFRVGRDGKSTVWFDAPEAHLRSLAVTRSGRVLVGGSGEGRIYEVDPSGSGRALYDSPLSEISAIHYDPARNIAWAAAVANIPPTAPPPPKQEPPRQAPSASTSGAADQRKTEPSATVDFSFSFDEPAGGPPPTGGSAELYRIDADGYVEVVRKFEREMVYAISSGKDSSIYLSTGPLGRIYDLKGNQISLVATVPEKQVVSFSNDPAATLITTTNSGAVYRLAGDANTKSEYRSPVKDTGRFSAFGHFRVEGTNLPRERVRASFRSGNTHTPDETWSRWFDVDGLSGKVEAPPARYLQWKIALQNPPRSVAVDAVVVAFMNRNAPPMIESLMVNDPGVVFVSGAFPAAPQVLEATNPDEYGMFTGLDTPREKTDPGKKLYRKGYRTISWKASDPNGDPLRYSVSFRRKHDSGWLRLRENVEENQINFDTSQLPDGVYEIRLVATDAPDNPESPLTDAREGVEFTVDNSPPTIQITHRGEDIIITVRDALSPVGKVEYSVDAQKWVRLLPEDGIADSTEERFLLKRKDVENRFVVVRAIDSFSNVATATVRVP